MTSINTHPAWCDPRVCTADGDISDHRSTPMAWKPAADDYLITTSLAQLDEHGACPHTGAAKARIELRDLVSCHPDGSDRVVGTDLTAADARLLAAALVCVAEQLEAEQRVGGVR